jgi:enamine deaminase RidA (YjgF/YER057c/UK114 family)
MTGSAQGQAAVTARSENGGSFDVFVHAMPASTREDPRTQFLSMADEAFRALQAHGLAPVNTVSGWIRFAAVPSWNWQEALAQAWQFPGALPITALLQPPAEPFCACSLTLQAVRSPRQSGVWHAAGGNPTAATVLRDGARHVRLMSVLPRAELCRDADVEDATYDMFAQAGHALTARGISFADVVRTWIHVDGIEESYASINRARNRYFAEQRLSRLPASTCVEGRPVGIESPVIMDVYAVSGGPGVTIDATGPATMNEAPSYGSAFARAATLREPGRRWLWISGTASIDRDGQVVSVGDIQGQLDCMFDHVNSLLSQAGMEMADVKSATAYLKRADYLAEFRKVAGASGLAETIPCGVVVADICRPQWLCEIELCAARNDAPPGSDITRP